ncbi:MAG: hypothetical protein HUJ51_05635 [Eggerthellaceae bacterium]|nr:hypothetical protein [Eggerthellaceae bacterium]
MFYKNPDRVEQNPQDIQNTRIGTLKVMINKQKLYEDNIDTIGITNQSETAIIWSARPAIPSITQLYCSVAVTCKSSRTFAVSSLS